MAPRVSDAAKFNRLRAKRRGLLQGRANDAYWAMLKANGLRERGTAEAIHDLTMQELVRLRERCKDENDRRMQAVDCKLREIAYRAIRNHPRFNPLSDNGASDAINLACETYCPEGENEIGDEAPTGEEVLAEVQRMTDAELATRMTQGTQKPAQAV